MMEQLLLELAFFLAIATGIGLITVNMKNEKTITVFGYLSVALFAIFFGLCFWTISVKESYQESIIIDYCNGKIVVDTVAVTKDGKPYELNAIPL